MKHPTSFETDEATSKRMANVKLKKGTAETLLAKELYHLGYRYWLNYKKLPGSPDIAIKKYRIAIFVDGEFWHGKDWKTRKTTLKRNRDYWIEKIEENIARDRRNDALLSEQGWQPIHFWEKDVIKNTANCINILLSIISTKQYQMMK